MKTIRIQATPRAPFGALRLVEFGPVVPADHLRCEIVDYARRMGWTEVAPYVFAPTCSMFGDDAAGEPYTLHDQDWLA